MPVTTPNTMMCHNFTETFMVSQKNEAWNCHRIYQNWCTRIKIHREKGSNSWYKKVFCERQSKPATMKKTWTKIMEVKITVWKVFSFKNHQWSTLEKKRDRLTWIVTRTSWKGTIALSIQQQQKKVQSLYTGKVLLDALLNLYDCPTLWNFEY